MDVTNERSTPRSGAYGAAARLFDEQLSAELAPTEASKHLEVALVWGNTILDVRHFESGVCTVGGGKGNAFALHFPSVGQSYQIASVSGGKAEIKVPEGAGVRVKSGGKATDSAGRQLTLGLNDRAEVILEGVSLIFRWVKPIAIVTDGAKAIDFSYARTLVVSLLGAAALVSAIFMTDINAESLSEDLFKNPAKYAKFVVTAPEIKKTELKLEVKKEQPTEVMTSTKYQNTSNTKSLSYDKRQQDIKKVQSSGLLALMGGGDGATSNVFSTGGMGTQLVQALGSLKDSGVSDSGGLGGFGSRGVGMGGGPGGLGIGGIGTAGGGRGAGGNLGNISIGAGAKKSATIIPSNPTVVGGCERAVIGREINKRANEIRYCYEAELTRNPTLSGKVTVSFTIDPSGSVDDASIANSTLGNQKVESCIAGRVRRWKFPEPKGGGVCVINYPWVFKAAGADE